MITKRIKRVVKYSPQRKPNKLPKYFGILSEKEGDEMLQNLEEHRAAQIRLLRERIKKQKL